VVSGYVREVKNGFVTFHLIEKIRVTVMKWLNGIQITSSLLFFLKVVRLRVSCEHGEAAIRETRVSRLCRSTTLGVGQRHDTLPPMRYKRFNVYHDYLNTFVYMVKICL